MPPADLHETLLADPVTRAGAVARLCLDEALAERLAADPDEEVRAALAEHPALPAAVRDALAADPAPDVRVKVFLREDTPEALRATVHTGLTAGAEAGAGGAFSVTEEGLSCEIALAGLRFTLVPWVRADPVPYVASPYVCFRRSAAAARDLPAGARERLLDDPDALVRHTAAAAAPVLSPEAAERAERRHRRGGKLRGGPADHADFPPATLRRFAGDPDARIRVLALRDPELPAALVARLAADDETPIRRAAAGHPALPLAALLALVTDEEEDPEVREEAAASPVLPVSDMADLLTRARL
ncbi:hypothetical protein [Streptomyces sp. NPDC005805]|uniref:hypothetical protein n=1 Tax=Streptomyces sp. NPDC005805 TaxID=3157068 RepID=UPI003404FCAE